ncbi:37S ribosomal protein S24, mitochondrial [Oleoguttula sp. CCFEE 5521]
MATPIKRVCIRAASRSAVPRSFTTARARHASSQPADPDTLPPLDLSSLPSLAHADLQSHRELRALARKTTWEMPLLASLRRPFQPPTTAQPLRWRYTTYMGEVHPASRKVVLEFAPKDLEGMTEKAALKMAKLAGARWDPVKEIVKMSCESFETQAMNKKFLVDTTRRLVKEALNEEGDAFEDVPLDTRHVTNKRMLKRQKGLVKARLRRKDGGTGFPEEWKLTDERRRELAERRGEVAKLEALEVQALEAPSEEGVESEMHLQDGEAAMQASADPEVEATPAISGLDAIERALELRDKEKAAEPVMVEARTPLAKGKPTKGGISQRGRGP